LTACERWRWGSSGTEVGLGGPTYHPLRVIFVSCVPKSISFLKTYIHILFHNGGWQWCNYHVIKYNSSTTSSGLSSSKKIFEMVAIYLE
jgi:hypothetical protein